jgi:hypothetical protein
MTLACNGKAQNVPMQSKGKYCVYAFSFLHCANISERATFNLISVSEITKENHWSRLPTQLKPGRCRVAATVLLCLCVRMDSTVQRTLSCDHSFHGGRLWHGINRKLSRIHRKCNITDVVPRFVFTSFFVSNYLQVSTSHFSVSLMPSTFRSLKAFNLLHIFLTWRIQKRSRRQHK